jgi:hypothetical protein
LPVPTSHVTKRNASYRCVSPMGAPQHAAVVTSPASSQAFEFSHDPSWDSNCGLSYSS